MNKEISMENNIFNPLGAIPPQGPTSPPPLAPHPVITPAPGKKHLLIPIIIIAVALLVMGGAGAAYYVYVYNPSPDAIVAEALNKLQTAKSLHSAVVVQTDIKIPESVKNESELSLIPGLASLSGEVKLNIMSESDVDNSVPPI